MKATNKYLVVIAGPTAVGKTAMAVQVANHFATEIISADSRQFYSELDIGVAKPSAVELSAVQHHFIGHIPVSQNYTAADFEKDATEKLAELYKSHSIVVLTGGSGLFIDAVLKGLDPLPVNTEIRAQLEEKLAREGLDNLTAQLKELDPESWNTVDLNNPRRVIRALEICLSGEKPSEKRSGVQKQRDFTPVKIVLNTDRESLYNRINRRVDVMMQNGLLDEVKSLLPYRHLNALQTVGYQELFDYLDGTITLENAVELIKQHTRNYAKRQLTWFRKDKDHAWFEPDDLAAILQYINNKVI